MVISSDQKKSERKLAIQDVNRLDLTTRFLFLEVSVDMYHGVLRWVVSKFQAAVIKGPVGSDVPSHLLVNAGIDKCLLALGHEVIIPEVAAHSYLGPLHPLAEATRVGS